MKKFSGKNRLAVIALAVMIGVAGYMSFADAGKDKKKEYTDKKQVEVINYEDLSSMAENENSQAVKDENGQTEDVELNGQEDEIGDAVLTSAQVTSNMAAAKLNREQSRSRSKEALMDVIGDEALSDSAKKEATDTYVKLNDTIEKETDVETVLAAKGYSDAIVTISDEAVDVSLNVESLSDTERAQIEDIVIRKTGYDISSVAISVMGGK